MNTPEKNLAMRQTVRAVVERVKLKSIRKTIGLMKKRLQKEWMLAHGWVETDGGDYRETTIDAISVKEVKKHKLLFGRLHVIGSSPREL